MKWTPIGNSHGQLMRSQVDADDDTKEGNTAFVSPISYLDGTQNRPGQSVTESKSRRKKAKLMKAPEYMTNDEIRTAARANKSMLHPNYHFQMEDLIGSGA